MPEPGTRESTTTRKRMTGDDRAEQIRDAVTSHYVETGDGMDVAQIAEACGVSPSTIRRCLNLREHGGNVPGLGSHKESRQVQSRDYPGMLHGFTTVWVYEPTKRHVREILLREKRLRGAPAAVEVPEPASAKPTLCPTCGVNQKEFEDDDECAWCNEKRQEEQGVER